MKIRWITEEEGILLKDLLNEYYVEHSKLVNRILNKLPENRRADLQPDLLMRMNETNSVYSRDEDA